MKTFLLAAAFLLVFAARVFGQDQNPNSKTEAKCDKYLQTPLPAEASLLTVPKGWPGCNSYKLYAGLATKVDYDAARKCAWNERRAQLANIEPKDLISSVVGGLPLLTIIYVNGDGVERNLALAGRLVCESSANEHILDAIEARSSKPGVKQQRFTCGDVAYSTIEMNFCAAYQAEIAGQKRDYTLKSLSSHWPSEQQKAFRLLLETKESYVIAHGQGETDQGGTIRGLRVNGVEERQRDKFLAAVKAFESGHLPRGSANDFRKADSELNLLYRKAVAAAEAHRTAWEGAIKPEGIQEAERAWLKYRDAWVALAKLRYPYTDSNAWLTLLTINRAAFLRMTLCGIDSNDSSCPRK